MHPITGQLLFSRGPTPSWLTAAIIQQGPSSVPRGLARHCPYHSLVQSACRRQGVLCRTRSLCSPATQGAKVIVGHPREISHNLPLAPTGIHRSRAHPDYQEAGRQAHRLVLGRGLYSRQEDGCQLPSQDRKCQDPHRKHADGYGQDQDLRRAHQGFLDIRGGRARTRRAGKTRSICTCAIARSADTSRTRRRR